MVRALLILGILAAAGLLAWWLGSDDEAARTARAAAREREPDVASATDADPVSVEEETAELRGVVKDADGMPIAGVAVEVPLGSEEPPLRTATGENGRFSLDVATLGWTLVQLRHPDYVALETGARTDFDNEFELERGAPFTVLVLGAEGEPVEGAKVAASRESANTYGRIYFGTIVRSLGGGETGADGRLLLGAVPAETFDLRVSHPDYATFREQVELREIRPVEHVVRLGPGGVIEGAVFGPDGEPVAAADVEAGDRSAKTDPGGRYRLERVRAGFVEVRASKAEFGPGFFGERLGWDEAVPVEVRVGETTAPIDIHLGKPTFVTGRVTDEEGKPIPDAYLSVNVWGGYTRGDEFRTGADGRFRAGPFSVFRTAEVHVYARADGFQYRNSDGKPVGPGESVDVGTLKLVRGAVVRGRCVDEEGKPMAAAHVSASPGSESTRSAKDGSFELTNVPAGKTTVRAQREDLVSRYVSVFVAPREVVEGVVLELAPTRTIVGRVTTEDGKPRRNIVLVARAQALPDSVRSFTGWMGTTGEDGTYEIGGLAPGTYEVGVLGYGASMFWGSPKGEVRQVEAGATEVDFVEPFTGGVVTARVVSRRTGLPLDEFRFTTFRYRGFFPIFGDVGQRKNREGLFRFEFAEEGSWAVEFRAKGHASFRTPKVELKKGEEKDFGTIRLGDGGVIEGRVVDAQGVPVPFTRINILSPKFETNQDEPFTGTDGGFEVRGVSPGMYIVFAVSPRHPIGMVKNVLVREGKSSSVEVKFAEAAPLEVIVQREDGRPLKGAELFWSFPEIAPLTSKMVRGKIPPGYGDNTSDEAGRILQHALPAGAVTLFVEAKGFTPTTRQVQLDAGKSTRVEITLGAKK